MKDEPNDDALDALVTRSLVERGELVPTTIDEVLDTSSEDVDLPPALDRLYTSEAPPKNVVPLRPPPSRAIAYVVAVAAAIAAVIAWIVLRPEPAQISSDPARAPSASAATPATSPAPVTPIVVARPSCDASCCAGAECGAAKAELSSCPTERTCVPCAGTDDADTLYRVRVGDFVPDEAVDPKAPPRSIDLCIRVGASPTGEWACEPSRAPSSVRPHGRFLKKASRAADLEGGVAMELRENGKAIVGRWWSILKPSARLLCLGSRVVFEDDAHRRVGSLSMFLERTYFVAVAEREDPAALDAVARAFQFDGLVPRVLDARGRHVLALGPFDRGDAERVLASVRDRAPLGTRSEARIDSGDAWDVAW